MANFIEWLAVAVGSIMVVGTFLATRGSQIGCIPFLIGLALVILGLGFYSHWNWHYLWAG